MISLNDGSFTRLAPNGSGTAPDLTAAGPRIAPHCTWSTLSPIGSDHLPLLTVIDHFLPRKDKRDKPSSYLNLKRANWESFTFTFTVVLCPPGRQRP